MTSWTVALCVRSAAIARCFASSIEPLRPPRSNSRYDSVALVVSCERFPAAVERAVVGSPVVPNVEIVPGAVEDRPPLRVTPTVGKYAPRLDA
jgi:hypothetical protein